MDKKIESPESKIPLTILITAIIVGTFSYYFWNNKNYESTNSSSENSVFIKSSKEYAVMGSEIFSAFECSVLASTIEDTKEAERLFMFGYDKAKEFIGALIAGKIEEEDIRKEVPVGITWVLGGPSAEFIIGRIFDSAQEEVLDEVSYTNYDRSKLNSDDLQKSIARNKFRDGNCRLIGK